MKRKPSRARVHDINFPKSLSTVTNKLFQLSLNLLERLVLKLGIKTLERDHVECKTVGFFFSFPFSASLQTFYLTVRVNLNTQKYGFFCS